MHNIPLRCPHERTLVAKLLLTNRAHAQLRHQEVLRLIVYLLLVGLQMFGVVQALQDLSLSLPLQMMVQCNLEEVLDRRQWNVVRQDLQHRVRIDLLGIVLHDRQYGINVRLETPWVQFHIAVRWSRRRRENRFDQADVDVTTFRIIGIVRLIAILDGFFKIAEDLGEYG